MDGRRMGLLGLAFVVVVAGLLFGRVGGSVAEAQVIRMKFGHSADESHPAHLAAKQFVTMVEERTKGQIKIHIYPANTLGSPPEVAEQVRLGATDMAAPTSGQLDKWIKAYGVVKLPFVFDDYAHAHRALDGPSFQWFSQMAEKEGFNLLSNWEWGLYQMTNSKRPVRTPADVKGLKFRVPPEIQHQATMEALGAVTTVIAFPEVYLALSQGVADGQDNPIPTIFYNKFYEVQKYLAITRHIYSNFIHTISAKTWVKLTPEQQRVFREASQLAGTYMRQQIQAEEEELIAKMEKAGVVVTRPDPAPFRAAMGPAYERIGKFSGEENVKKFLEFVEAARKK